MGVHKSYWKCSNEIASKIHFLCSAHWGYLFLQHCSFEGGGSQKFWSYRGSQKYCWGTSRNSWSHLFQTKWFTPPRIKKKNKTSGKYEEISKFIYIVRFKDIWPLYQTSMRLNSTFWGVEFGLIFNIFFILFQNNEVTSQQLCRRSYQK